MNYKTEYVVILLIAIVIGFGLAFYANKSTTNQVDQATNEQTLAPRIQDALAAISNKNFSTLSSYIHPEKGVTFSPYQYVDTTKYQNFPASKVAAFANNFQSYSWGEYDGSGEPIELTIQEYWSKFVYDNNYLNKAQIGYNKQLSSGNSTNNISELFPDAISVEFYIPGSDQYGGMDWSSLTLVFENYNNELYLVAIAHGEWTI